MKRIRVQVAVDGLGKSIRWRSTLFGAQSIALESECARWMVDDPRANSAISERGSAAALDHVDIRIEDPAPSRLKLPPRAAALEAGRP